MTNSTEIQSPNRSRSGRRTLAWLFALATGATVAAQAPLPVAPIRNVPETFFGTTVDDPYRDLENVSTPAVATWMRAHSDAAHATLRGIPGRDAIRRRLAELDGSAAAQVTDVVRRPGDQYFYLKRQAGEGQGRLHVRRGLQGEERLIFDPGTLEKATGRPHAINYFEPSPDGRLVAVGTSPAGSEDTTLRVVNTSTGRQVGAEVPRALGGYGALTWTPDGREILFVRLRALPAGAPPADKYLQNESVRLQVGDGPPRLERVLLAGSDLDISPRGFGLVFARPGGRVLAVVSNGVSWQVSVWHSTLDAVRAGRPAWKRLVRAEDDITWVDLHGARVYALSFRNAPRLKVLTGDIETFSAATATVLIPESDRVIDNITVAADALYVSARDGNIARLYQMPFARGAAMRDIELPARGRFSIGSGASPELPGALVAIEGWTRARQIYAISTDGTVTNTGLQPAGPFDAPSDLVATEVVVPSHDGVRVPMSIVHKRGTPLDGRNPTLLFGYGAYGMTAQPDFPLRRLAWFEAGGVFAVANPRGSGVFGTTWHEAGKGPTKPNTWKDMIACAEYLVAQRWTSPSRLALESGSAGGILAGRAMTERPDLFAAVVIRVGALDMIRMELTPNGPPNIAEYGTRATEAGFRGLLAMSTYHHIRDGVSYPAVFLSAGVNDPRVDVWQSAKTAARLMAATASKRPVLLRLDYDAGHGPGSSAMQQADERADIYSFLLWQFGVPGFERR